jgi:hypothetical protein
MSDAIAEYQKTLADFTAAKRRLLRLAELFISAGQQLKSDWRRVVVANHAGMKSPGFNVSPRHVSIDANDWPSADQLVEALNAAHEAQLAITNAWARVPEERRNVLVPPPKD